MTVAFLLPASLLAQTPQITPIEITIDAHAATTPLPHFWERMFGSGRAMLSLREDYRDDLRTVKKATDLKYVRFHAILHDETGLYSTNAQGKAIYNFSYIDKIYDGLLENGVRPFVELSFMPKKLAADPAMVHTFSDKANISPPRDPQEWEALIEAFTRHLVGRYGIEEVSQWYFEVWNEPNIDFWDGNPKLQTYLDLYEHTARAVKRVDTRLRIGGPSTARTDWAQEFLARCKERNVPVDFLSTHVYGNDMPKDIFGTDVAVPPNHMVCQAVNKVHQQIAASAYPQLPLFISEFNAAWDTQPEVTDSTFMGPWLADTIRQCDGLTEMMSYWSFSDVFDEQGVVKTPFYGGYGLIASGGIPKPAFNAFVMLHQLGETRLATSSDSALVTRRKDGSLAIALWNYAPASKTPNAGPSRIYDLRLLGTGSHIRITRLDQSHGNVMPAFEAMGRPDSPTRAQLAELRVAGQSAPTEELRAKDGKLRVHIPSQGLVLLEIR